MRKAMRRVKTVTTEWIKGTSGIRVLCSFDVDGVGIIWCQSANLGVFTDEVMDGWAFRMRHAISRKYAGMDAPGLYCLGERSWQFSG